MSESSVGNLSSFSQYYLNKSGLIRNPEKTLQSLKQIESSDGNPGVSFVDAQKALGYPGLLTEHPWQLYLNTAYGHAETGQQPSINDAAIDMQITKTLLEQLFNRLRRSV